MEVLICAPKPPKMPSMPERQPMQQPDQGAEIPNDDRRKMIRRAAYAGLSGAPGGLGSSAPAQTVRPTLG
jgi:hypothetical protein